MGSPSHSSPLRTLQYESLHDIPNETATLLLPVNAHGALNNRITRFLQLHAALPAPQLLRHSDWLEV